MEMIVAFTACVLLVALGDILSIASRAKIPAMAGIILLYLAATALGMPLEDILRANLEKLERRYPDGFSTERSVGREADDR